MGRSGGSKGDDCDGPRRVARPLAIALASSFLVLGGAPARAVDGVVELNQTCALQTGCLAGDTAGFPITLGTSGSYRLTSNLAVPDANTNGLTVTVDDVAIDLNGFSIRGPVVCTGSPIACTPNTGTGIGINAPFLRISVRDGSVTGMGSTGVSLSDAALVSHVVASSNRLNGISAGSGSDIGDCSASSNGATGIFLGGPGVVRDSSSIGNGSGGIALGLNGVVRGNLVRSNGGNGISTGIGSTISGNSVRENTGTGIAASSAAVVTDNGVFSNDGNGIAAGAGSIVRSNTVSTNTGVGLSFPAVTTGYRENVITSNTGGTVTSGTNLGNNLCNGTTVCP